MIVSDRRAREKWRSNVARPSDWHLELLGWRCRIV